jgi:flagellar basal body-associated protein FliL
MKQEKSTGQKILLVIVAIAIGFAVQIILVPIGVISVLIGFALMGVLIWLFTRAKPAPPENTQRNEEMENKALDAFVTKLESDKQSQDEKSD